MNDVVFRGLVRARIQRAARVRAKQQARHKATHDLLSMIAPDCVPPIQRMPAHGRSRWSP